MQVSVCICACLPLSLPLPPSLSPSLPLSLSQPSVPKTFLLVAAQYSLRRIALDNHYVDVTLYDFRDGYEVNAVDYLLMGSGEGFVFCAEAQPPTGGPGDSVWRYIQIVQYVSLPPHTHMHSFRVISLSLTLSLPPSSHTHSFCSLPPHTHTPSVTLIRTQV